MKRGILLLALLGSSSVSAIEFDASFSTQLPVWPVRLVEDARGYIVSGSFQTNAATGGTEEWRDVPWIARLRDDGQLDRTFRTRHLTRKGTFDPKLVFGLSNGLIAVRRIIPTDGTNTASEIVYLNRFGRVKQRVSVTNAFKSPPTHGRAEYSVDSISAVMRTDGSLAFWCEEGETRGVRIISPDGALTTNWLGRSGRVWSGSAGYRWSIYNLRVSADDIVSWTQEAPGGSFAYHYAVGRGTNPIPSGKYSGAYESPVAVSQNGVLYMGGSSNSAPSLRRYNVAGIDANFAATFPPDTRGKVLDACIQTDGKILFAGYFYNTNLTGFRFIGRLHADGAWDSSFNHPELKGAAYRIHIDRLGRILLVGNFSDPNAPERTLGLIRLRDD